MKKREEREGHFSGGIEEDEVARCKRKVDLNYKRWSTEYIGGAALCIFTYIHDRDGEDLEIKKWRRAGEASDSTCFG